MSIFCKRAKFQEIRTFFWKMTQRKKVKLLFSSALLQKCRSLQRGVSDRSGLGTRPGQNSVELESSGRSCSSSEFFFSGNPCQTRRGVTTPLSIQIRSHLKRTTVGPVQMHLKSREVMLIVIFQSGKMMNFYLLWCLQNLFFDFAILRVQQYKADILDFLS